MYSNVQTADDMYTECTTPHGNLRVALHTTTKTTTNKKKDDNDCSGIMGKPSCSAVQLGRKDKPWTVWPEPLLSISTCFMINSTYFRNPITVGLFNANEPTPPSF